MMFCKKCGDELVELGKKYVCRNEHCDYQELLSSQIWYRNLADNKQLWNEVILLESPSLIAQQYEMLHRLLSEGATYGALFKVKDLLEVILKFPSLILVSEMVEVEKDSSKHNEILSFMTSKPLSLGDWQQIAIKLINTNGLSKLIDILKDINKVFTKNNIVLWRNDRIGHGALLLDTEVEFQQDIESMIYLVAEHFHRCEDLYSSVRISLKNNYDSITLIGRDELCYVRIGDETLVAEVEGKETNLDPFVQFMDNNLYLFDSYYSNKLTASFLNYSFGYKKKQKHTKFTEFYNNIHKKKNITIAATSAENNIYMRSQADTINRLMSSEDLIEFKFLQEELKIAIEENEKGYLLLEMANGMGKTTFARTLDPFVYNTIRLKNVVCRTYYINDIYSHVPSIFVSKVSDILRQLNVDGDMLDGDIPNIDLEFSEPKEKVSELLNVLFSAHKKYNYAEKMILIVDGIDEIPASNGTTIFDVLPSSEMLGDGIYILITCRLEHQLSTFTRDKIALFPFKKRLSIERTEQRYQGVLEKFIDNQLKKKKLKSIPEDVRELISISEGSFISLNILTRVYLEDGMERVLTSSTNATAEKYFLELLSKMYGKEYFHEMLLITISLTFFVVPPNLKQLSRIFEEEISFKFLCFINELKPLLDIRRTGKGNMISIHRKELRELLEEKYESEIDEYMSELFGTIDFIIGNTQERPLDDDEVVYVVNALIALLNRNCDNFGWKFGERISPVFRLLSKHFQQGSAYNSEQQQQCYYLLYTHINLVVEALAKAHIQYNPDDYLFLMNTLCKLLINSNMFDIAVEKLEEGLAMLEEQGILVGHLSLSESYNSLATLYSKQGIKAKAEQYFMMATTERNQIKRDNLDIMVRALKSESFQMLNEANFYKNKNESEKALIVLRELGNKLSQFEELVGNGDLIVSEKINMLKTTCNILKRVNPKAALGLISNALGLLPSMYEQDEALARGTESDLLLNLGQVYRQLEQPLKAINCFDNAIKINKQVLQLGGTIVPEQMVSLYNSKGNVQYDERNYKQAILLYNQAIEQYEEFIAQGRQILPNLLFQLLCSRGNAYKEDGNLEAANLDYQRASKIKYDNELIAYTLQGKLK